MGNKRKPQRDMKDHETASKRVKTSEPIDLSSEVPSESNIPTEPKLVKLSESSLAGSPEVDAESKLTQSPRKKLEEKNLAPCEPILIHEAQEPSPTDLVDEPSVLNECTPVQIIENRVDPGKSKALHRRTLFVRSNSYKSYFRELCRLAVREWGISREKGCMAINCGDSRYTFVVCKTEEQFHSLSLKSDVIVKEGVTINLVDIPEAEKLLEAVSSKDSDGVVSLLRNFPSEPKPPVRRVRFQPLQPGQHRSVYTFSSLSFSEGEAQSFCARIFKIDRNARKFRVLLKWKGTEFEEMTGVVSAAENEQVKGDTPASGHLWTVCLFEGSKQKFEFLYNSETAELTEDSLGIRAACWNFAEKYPIALNESSLTEIENCELHTLDGTSMSAIGHDIASKIVQERDSSPFIDWSDFTERVFEDSPEGKIWAMRLMNENIHLTSFIEYQKLIFDVFGINIQWPSSGEKLSLPSHEVDERRNIPKCQMKREQALFINAVDVERESRPGWCLEGTFSEFCRDSSCCPCKEVKGDSSEVPLREIDSKYTRKRRGPADTRKVVCSMDGRLGRIVLYYPVLDPDGKSVSYDAARGTGTVFDEYTVLTAGHCVFPEFSRDLFIPETNTEEMRVCFFERSYYGDDLRDAHGRPKNPAAFAARKLKGSNNIVREVMRWKKHLNYLDGEGDPNYPEIDFGLLFFDNPFDLTGCEPVKFSSHNGAEFSMKDALYVYGYGSSPPSSHQESVKESGYTSEWPLRTHGYFRSIHRTTNPSRRGFSSFLACYYSQPGNSGGPVLTEGGVFMGVHSGAHRDFNQVATCTSGPLLDSAAVDVIMKWIKEDKAERHEIETSQKTEE